MAGKIEFGTDGWRAVIAKEFTFENVGKVASAIGSYLLKNYKKPSCAVGYDTRFLSKEFAHYCASVLASMGVKVYLSRGFNTSPILTFSVKKRKLSGGIMITASHNPPYYNGVKFKTHLATSAGEDITKSIELEVKNIDSVIAYEIGKKITDDNICLCDFHRDYVDFLKGYADLKLLKNSHVRVMYDTMYGSASGLLQKIVSGTSAEVVPFRDEVNPSFGGINPEPIEKNLESLKDKMKSSRCDFGIALDGDGDRIGAVTRSGVYIECGKIFAMLLLYLIEERGYRGSVVKTISGSYLIDRIAKKYGLKLHETPIGFKNIAQIMLSETVLMGAEESGGMGFMNYIPERDGILSGILMMEAVAKKKKSIVEILDDIRDEYGASYYMRDDVRCEGITREKLYQALLKNPPKELGNSPVVNIKTFDGIKFSSEDGSWLLLRFSGTEPILRIYTESPSRSKTKNLLEFGKDVVREAGGKIEL